MNDKHDTMTNSTVECRIEELKVAPDRDPLKAASGRARFLHEAAVYRHALSSERSQRQEGRIFPFWKERLSINALVTVILVAFLLIGGGATVAAAQDDLPNQSLYQLKLWTENATLVMNRDSQEQADLLMAMAQTRVQEMSQLVGMGVTPPDYVQERLQQHLDQALRLAANMDEGKRDKLLRQLHDQLQAQDRIMEKLQLHGDAEIVPQLTRTRQMLQLHLQLVDKGLAEPHRFQYMLENQLQSGQDEGVVPGSNQPGQPGTHQNDDRGKPSDTPGRGNGNGNNGSNESNGGPHPDKPNGGNGDNGQGKGVPGGPNLEGSQDGMNGQGGNGPGGGGGNK